MDECSETPEQLLPDVKTRLDVTWEDEATDRKLRELILSGMAYLDGKYGRAADYASAGEPRTLLMEYVRYARDDALDVFENNYQSRILAMQNDRKVSEYAGSLESAVPDEA